MSQDRSGFERELEALKPLSDVNQLLHTLRTYELGAVPRGAETFLSAGCAGLWYFEWIEQTYGRVSQHIGIEYFMPKPEGLPSNVTWLANTVGNMSAVAGQSVDLVFSGQNIEHLWPSDVSGFLLESSRTLKTGGLLVIDSPNRLVTRPLEWKHPQHTMEFTPDEIRTLLSLSGFEVTSVRGMWIVRDPFTDAILSFGPEIDIANWPFLRRVSSANLHPDHSFLWWAEARKTGNRADAGAINGFMADLYRREWPARLRQMSSQGHIRDGGEVAWSDRPGTCVLHGPYVPLPAGKYTVTFLLRRLNSAQWDGAVCTCDVLESGQHVLASQVLYGSDLGLEFKRIQLTFAIPDTRFGVEFRVCLNGHEPVEARMEVGFEADSILLSKPL